MQHTVDKHKSVLSCKRCTKTISSEKSLKEHDEAYEKVFKWIKETDLFVDYATVEKVSIDNQHLQK